MSLRFREGDKSCVAWETEVHGRTLAIEIYFNKRFSGSSKSDSVASWTRTMRPDCSLRVRPISLLPDTDPGALDIWLHFDAKYRVDWTNEQFDSGADDGDVAIDVEATRQGRSKGEDLLKMHAYRDAIRRSAGAYDLFPGTLDAPPFREFQELLPGLGAFVLRPSSIAGPVGAGAVRDFLREVLIHVADRASQHERDRYWRALVRQDTATRTQPDRRFPVLSRPPRDEFILCVHLANRSTYDEIRATGILELPADQQLSLDSQELRAEWLLLVVPSGRIELWRRASAWMIRTHEHRVGAIQPQTVGVLAAQVEESAEPPAWVSALNISQLRSQQPDQRSAYALTWTDLLLTRSSTR